MTISSQILSSTIKSPPLPSQLLLRPLQTRPLFVPTTNFATMSHNRKNKNSVPEKGREVAISKGLSYILRHAAEREGLKMDAQGYANVADVLAWRKLKSLQTTFPEIIDAVATSDKKRFALLHVPSAEAEQQPNMPSSLCVTEREPATATTGSVGEEGQAEKQENMTEKALAVKDPEPSNFLIRATQGHSMKSVDAALFLEKLSLSEEEKLPTTVVHGTYHSAWLGILNSGGLRCMGRHHVHFATGPSLESVLPLHEDGTTHTEKGQDELGLNDGPVISGMRRDAQVLIYIDLKKALAAGCPFWRSENGVILSEGFEPGADSEKKKWDKGSPKLVPLEFFDVVVERKRGLGKIWEDGKVVQELPAELTKKGNPKGNPKGKNTKKGKPT